MSITDRDDLAADCTNAEHRLCCGAWCSAPAASCPAAPAADGEQPSVAGPTIASFRACVDDAIVREHRSLRLPCAYAFVALALAFAAGIAHGFVRCSLAGAAVAVLTSAAAFVRMTTAWLAEDLASARYMLDRRDAEVPPCG